MKNIIFHITFDPWRPQMLGHTTSFKKGMVIKMKNGVIPYSMWVLFRHVRGLTPKYLWYRREK